MINKFFSPLEQFDSITFLKDLYFAEITNLYSFYIFENEYNLIQQLSNSYSSTFGLFFYTENYWIFVVALLMLDFASSLGLKLLFGGIVFSIFFPTAFDYLYITTSFLQVELLPSNEFFTYLVSKGDIFALAFLSNINVELGTQLHYFFAFDENILSFLLAFFFLGGSEEEEDQDFILEEESDFIDDVVAPLFFANLGKDIEGNGELLVKVSSVFAFVLINNLMGMLPYSDTGTSSLMLTFWVALSIFVSLHRIMFHKQGINFFFLYLCQQDVHYFYFYL